MKKGYVLKATNTTSHYFSTYIREDLQMVEDPNYAWFTESLDLASAMLIDLTLKGMDFRIREHSYP